MAELWHQTQWLRATYNKVDRDSKKVIVDTGLTTAERAVAVIYSDFCRPDRTTWVATVTLMERTGMSKNTVRDGRQGLVKKGWLREVKKSTGRRAAVYELVIPEHRRGSVTDPLEERSGSVTDPLRADSDSRRGSISEPRGSISEARGSVADPKYSSRKPPAINLSVAQRTAKQLLACGDDDERLMLIPKMIRDRDIRNASGWLRRVHQRGDLERLLNEAANENTSRWGSVFKNVNIPEGWGPPGRSPDEWPRATVTTHDFEADPSGITCAKCAMPGSNRCHRAKEAS